MAWYTANDIRQLREETHRSMQDVKWALNQVDTIEAARVLCFTKPVMKCRCGIPHGEPHP